MVVVDGLWKPPLVSLLLPCKFFLALNPLLKMILSFQIFLVKLGFLWRVRKSENCLVEVEEDVMRMILVCSLMNLSER